MQRVTAEVVWVGVSTHGAAYESKPNVTVHAKEGKICRLNTGYGKHNASSKFGK